MSKVRLPEKAMAHRETNSKHTRVQPVFGWLEKHGGTCWSEQLLRLASGLTHPPTCGAVIRRISVWTLLMLPIPLI
jgi:hypothetical protein